MFLAPFGGKFEGVKGEAGTRAHAEHVQLLTVGAFPATDSRLRKQQPPPFVDPILFILRLVAPVAPVAP